MDSLLHIPLLGEQLQLISEYVSTTSCNATNASEDDDCRDEPAALQLKLIAIFAILFAGIAGVTIPLLTRKNRHISSNSSFFVLAKAFAAGVILATGFVHMLHDAESALSDPCLPETPWKQFPFSGFFAMIAALGTLVVDFVGTQFYERKNREKEREASNVVGGGNEEDGLNEIFVVERGTEEESRSSGGEDKMHIVGIRAHAAAHRHSHSHEHGACDGALLSQDTGNGHGHGHDHIVESQGRHVVVSQILELGIVSHSVIIGLSLGVSQSPCTIRPLVAALSFHQFFEGFALGGCISQAQFKNFSAAMMATFFAITTPAGIALGAGVSSFYNPNSPRALVIEGLLDSISAGILIYMALVDLIAADFLSRRMSCNMKVQIGSYVALFLGALAMASLALWA